MTNNAQIELSEEGAAYAVSSGEYSSYRVKGIFDTREKRDNFLAELLKVDGDAFAEEFALNPPVVRSEPRVTVHIDRGGNVLQFDCNTTRSDNPVYVWYYDQQIDGGYMTIEIVTDDVDRAIKVANEKRAQLIAMGVWGDTMKTREMLNREGE